MIVKIKSSIYHYIQVYKSIIVCIAIGFGRRLKWEYDGRARFYKICVWGDSMDK